MSSSQEKSIEILNLRLAEIEEQLFGTVGFETCYPKMNESSGSLNEPLNVIKMMIDIDNKLKSLTIGKERFNQCYNELNKLQQWIATEQDFEFLLNSTDSSKFEEILAFEDEIKADTHNAEQIKQLELAIDLPHIHKVTELKPTLDQLKLDLLRMKKESDNMEIDIKLLIDSYTGWFNGLVDKLNQFNSDLTELERKKEESKYE